MHKLFLYIPTIFKLGIGSVAYLAWYRFTLKSGLRKPRFRQRPFVEKTNFFKETAINTAYPEAWKKQLTGDADRIVNGQIRYYAFHWKAVGNPPNWFLNPFNGTEYPTQQHWTALPDFHPAVGDIKNVWEASRFEWVVTLARAYAVTGNKHYLDTLNDWLNDWTAKNPLNTGPNWKCGQETSIRLFNLLNAAFILEQHTKPSPALIEFIGASLERISKNLRYAMAQNNNHGTSEAAALYIGGLWLKHVVKGKNPGAKNHLKTGRYWLENRVKKLISESGSFSQHSVTYHRVVLDTLCFVEFWRNTLNDKPFSSHYYRKAKVASNWLFQMTDEISGDAPNLGSNDGALFLNTHSCSYRDFRPSLQMAAILFFKATWFENEKYNEPLYWFGLNQEIKKNAPEKQSFSAHGYASLQGERSWALIKWPFYKFRPSHNDALHVDIWHNGKNILCDAGSYSYNPDKEFQHNLKSVHFHNTVIFDDQEQMPKLSRFLLANWLKADNSEIFGSKSTNTKKWEGSYTDAQGNRHQRVVEYINNQWIIADRLTGKFKKAKIAFNLNSLEVQLQGRNVSTPDFQIQVSEFTKPTLKNIFVSNHYWEKQTVKRLELEINQPGKYKTIITLKD
jgi:hypothetical protein